MSLYSYSLQIEKYESEIKKAIESNKTTIIKGPTGCGKSTFVPWIFRNSKVAIIEPRRIAVTSIFKILQPHIPDIGYKMRFNKSFNKNTKVMLYTDGCFLNEIHDLDYDYIIVDEAHERSIRTDLILSILKVKFKNKLILMSATIDTEKLEKFFDAKTYSIPSKSYPVDIKYLEKPTSDYIIESYLTIKNILKTRSSTEKKDILVFLPGEEDINDLAQLCKKLPSISVSKIFASMNDVDQQKIFEPSSLTKVIISTNVCETSLTIPNVKYVIDTGLYKTKFFNGITYFGIIPINRNSETQRLGRCNRLGPGVCYKLYTEFQNLSSPVPEIMRSDLSSAILILINLKQNILNFEFLDYPPLKNVISAIIFLTDKNLINITYKDKKNEIHEDLSKMSYGVLESNVKDMGYAELYESINQIQFKITDYGRQIIEYPFDVHLSHLYHQCLINDVGYYGSLLISLISQENYTFLTSSKDIEKKSDILYLVEIMEGYLEAENKSKYCVSKNLPIKGMQIADKIFKSLSKSKGGHFGNF